MKRFFLTLVTIFSLVTSGCNMLIRLPVGGPKLISTQTFTVNETLAGNVTITDAAITLAPSDGSVVLAGKAAGLANGEIQYNVANWEPAVVVDGNILRIEQTIPENNISSTPRDSINAWDLELGDTLTNISVSLTTGNYTLTFADTLPNGTTINVSAGVGNLRLEFPADVTANVEVQRGPANIASEGAWRKNGKSYTSGHSGPIWTVNINIGVGNLTLVRP